MKMETVVSEFEGTLLKNKDTFSYFMLLAFHASGVTRFTVLLFLWPVIALLDVFNFKNVALKLMIFVATVGLREADVEQVARAIVPKFYMDDLNMDTWMVFSSLKKKGVVTRMPRVMVEWFAKEHLAADEVIGPKLIVNRFGFVIGLVRETDIDQYNMTRVAKLFVDHKPCLGLGKPTSTSFTTFMSSCEEQIHEASHSSHTEYERMVQPPKPVIFHASRLVKRPTPTNALITLVYIPFGIVLAAIRILVVLTLPRHALPYVSETFGIKFIVKGKPPSGNISNNGLLFVCNHRSIIDPFVITMVLGRKIPIITSNKSRFYDIFCPVPMVRFTRNRDVDATTLQRQLSKGDVVMCPEGAGCFQPFVLRFSQLFAELTNKIMPVAINCKYGFFDNPKRSWDVLDIIMLFMNPTIVYEVTFLNQLRLEETCFYGKSSNDVANHVQRILASTLGFQCTSFNRKEMVRVVFGKS